MDGRVTGWLLGFAAQTLDMGDSEREALEK